MPGTSRLFSAAVAKREVLNAVREVIRAEGMESQVNVACSWITNHVPTEFDLSTPPRLLYRLTALHMRLGGDWEQRLTKRELPLRFDLKVGEDKLIEIDFRNHFSSARLDSLDFYDGLDHSLDLSEYRELCEVHREAADRFQRSRQTAEFPFPGGRSAQVAFFDCAKDLLAPAHGFDLIRLPAPDGEMTSEMARRLRGLLMDV